MGTRDVLWLFSRKEGQEGIPVASGQVGHPFDNLGPGQGEVGEPCQEGKGSEVWCLGRTPSPRVGSAREWAVAGV